MDYVRNSLWNNFGDRTTRGLSIYYCNKQMWTRAPNDKNDEPVFMHACSTLEMQSVVRIN